MTDINEEIFTRVVNPRRAQVVTQKGGEALSRIAPPTQYWKQNFLSQLQNSLDLSQDHVLQGKLSTGMTTAESLTAKSESRMTPNRSAMGKLYSLTDSLKKLTTTFE